MATTRKIVPFLRKWEGGWADDPLDRGGATMAGITLSTYERYCRLRGYPRPTKERLKSLSREEWEKIFKTMYWDVCMGDMIISEGLAIALVDFYWHSGYHGVKHLQKAINEQHLSSPPLVVDGKMGVQTLARLNGVRHRDKLLKEYLSSRRSFLRGIVGRNPAQVRFLKGWLRRVDDLEKVCVPLL